MSFFIFPSVEKDETNDNIYWLALNRVDSIGPVSFVKLIEHFGSAKAVFKASQEEILAVFGIRSGLAESIISFRDFDDVSTEFYMLQEKGIEVVRYTDSCYPARLKQISSFPPLIYVWGKKDGLNHGEWLGVVGSRKITDYGVMVCRKIISELVKSGVHIVSGFALGVDIEAHRTVCEAGGSTLAVLGNGLQYIHPPSHKRYVDQILKHGAFISEFPYSMPPQPQLFPRRNRIISGLSRGVLVVEADEKSGALITARYALDQNRDVFAIPGSIFSSKSQGCHQLIQQGAKIVVKAQDIFDEWEFRKIPQNRDVLLNQDEQSIYASCLQKGLTPDEIIEHTGFSPEQVTVLLTKLELDGRMRSLPGRRYQSL